jgi:cell division transport system ATP-binding protein
MTLSTGERQRVGIARALVHKPSIILADEPTGNLDPVLAQETIELFQEFNQVGVTVIVATHNLALIARLKHRILTLDDGHLITE